MLIRNFSCSWRKAQLKARVYYFATLLSRVGIVLGIVLRLIGARGDKDRYVLIQYTPSNA